MHSFFKRKTPGNSQDAEPQPKKRRLVSASEDPSLSPYPRRIVCWNCNGLSARLRCEGDVRAIKNFLTEYAPDILFLSEVRLPADHSGVPNKATSRSKWFRHRIRSSDSKSTEDHGLVLKLLSSPQCMHYKPYFSLADTKYAGTAMLINTCTTAAPVSVRFNMDAITVPRSVHDRQGRVIVAKFPAFSILHTYSPNNGWNEDHFQRRRNWDKSVKSFMERKKNAGVPMMWVGDLNVAPEDIDLSHATYFRRQKGGRNSKDRGASVAPEDVGQPGCTDGERTRFRAVLRAGDLVDAYRAINGSSSAAESFTWRGAVANRAMRIDHCAVSRALLPALQDVRVLGARDGMLGFMGSDHCPLLTVVRDEAGRLVAEARAASEGDADAGAHGAPRRPPTATTTASASASASADASADAAGDIGGAVDEDGDREAAAGDAAAHGVASVSATPAARGDGEARGSRDGAEST